MVEYQRVKLRWVFLTICLPCSQIVLADNDGGRHWSEGVYFPSVTMPRQQTRDAYASRVQSRRQLRPSSVGKAKYNPWTVRKVGNRSRPSPDNESFGYPSLDYDPYKRIARHRQRTPAEGEPHALHPSEFAAMEYYSGRSRHELNTVVSRPDYQNSESGRVYVSRSYAPGDGNDGYYPDYNSTYKPRAVPTRGNYSPPFPSHAPSEYPSQDYNPYLRTAQGRQRISVEGESYPTHPGDFAAAEYYPDQSRYASYPSPTRLEYQPRNNSQIYDSRPYVISHGLERYLPSHDSANYLWAGLNPFFITGMGLPYLPQWW